MRPRLNAIGVCLLVLAGGFAGCRSTRYAIGKLFSPDWLKSRESKDRYVLYTNNGQHFYDEGSRALLEEQNPAKARRNFRQAEMQFKKALEYNGYSLKAHLGAGFALFHQGTPEKCREAIDFLEKANDLRRGEWRVHLGLARAHQLLARHEGKVLDALQAAARHASPGEKLALEARIRAARTRRTHELETVLREARLIQEVAPDQHQSFLLVGTTCAELHRYDEAVPNLKKYIQLARVTRGVFRKLKESGSLPAGVSGTRSDLARRIRGNLIRDAEAKQVLATVYYYRGDYLRALKCLDSIYETNPHALPRYLADRASVKAKLGDYAGAVEDLNTLVKKLAGSGHTYDDVVRRALTDRDTYLARLRRAPDRPRTNTPIRER